MKKVLMLYRIVSFFTVIFLLVVLAVTPFAIIYSLIVYKQFPPIDYSEFFISIMYVSYYIYVHKEDLKSLKEI